MDFIVLLKICSGSYVYSGAKFSGAYNKDIKKKKVKNKYKKTWKCKKKKNVEERVVWDWEI